MPRPEDISPSWRIVEADCREVLAGLPAGAAHTCVTSPPYFGLRDYGTGEWQGGDEGCDHRQATDHQNQGATSLRVGRSNVEEQRNENFRQVCGKCGARRVDQQLGLERTPDEYVARLVEVFRELRRVLRDDGTLWLNLGDSYASGEVGRKDDGRSADGSGNFEMEQRPRRERRIAQATGLPSKNLFGIPWRVALALQADGWYLRSDVIWAKPNPMPESVTDRPTKAHEYLFLLSKQPRYYYDAAAIKEQATKRAPGNATHKHTAAYENGDEYSRLKGGLLKVGATATRNKRTVWTIAAQPYAGAHFATFPPKLVEPCILAGSPEGGTVLDPFAGSGTTGMVALRHDRSFLGIELNPTYAQLARERITTDTPLQNTCAEEAA